MQGRRCRSTFSNVHFRILPLAKSVENYRNRCRALSSAGFGYFPVEFAPFCWGNFNAKTLHNGGACFLFSRRRRRRPNEDGGRQTTFWFDVSGTRYINLAGQQTSEMKRPLIWRHEFTLEKMHNLNTKTKTGTYFKRGTDGLLVFLPHASKLCCCAGAMRYRYSLVLVI